jgi:hypothetical protein
MKKIFGVSFVIASFVSFASAYSGGDLGYNLGNGMERLIYLFESLFGPFFAVLLGGTGEFLFERILFLFIVLSIVYVVVSRIDVFKNNKNIVWIVTVTVSLLSTRFLSETSLVQTIILPYSILGVSLTAILPLIIYFYFVRSFEDSAVLRKSLWIMFLVVYFGLWGSRYNELGGISWIYFWVGFLAFLFFIFDGTINRALIKQRYGELDHARRMGTVATLRERLDKNEEQFSLNYINSKHYKSTKKHLQKQIKELMKARL